MKCREAEKYIYLGDEINRDEKTQFAFEGHLRECSRCARLHAEMFQYNALVSKISDTDLPLELNEEIVQEVIKKINFSKAVLHIKKNEPFWKIFYVPAFRFAVASLLIAITLFYFGEEFTATASIKILENRYGIASKTETTKTNWASAQELVSSASSLYNFFNGDKKFLELPGEWMLIKKSEVVKLMEEYRRYADTNLSGSDYEKYLSNILGEEIFRRLTNDREKINKLLDRYSRQEN